MALTDTGIRKARATDKVQKLTDGAGLYLHIAPTGGKLWRWAYRFEGKQKTMALGAYPAVSLSVAREKRDEARKLLAAGVDPMAQKKASKQARQDAAANTFEAVAREWWEHWKPSRSARYADYVIRRLEQNVFPKIGALPVSNIEAPKLKDMAQAVAKRGAADMARRCLQMCGQVFQYAIEHGKASRNPAVEIKPSTVLPVRKKQNYARVDARELPALLRKIEGYQGTPTTRLAMKLMALTFVRTGELIGARWDEFDLDASRWDIPAERMKMRTPHIVPLSTHAIHVLNVLKEITGGRVLLFPGERDHDKPMSNNTILAALKRMGYAGRMTGHGFRGVASTLLHELGYDHAHIELQLAHTERNAVSAAYNHALYLPQRAKMMQDWGDFLDGLARGNVVPLRRLAA
ncbi:MAG: tyrosine-type recombinase/integrase [Pseudomonadota bacterium]|nr:tyrosine-type recombinase/integrase [Pseudomonadota bacterium]